MQSSCIVIHFGDYMLFCLRYHLVKSPQMYGRVVFKHLNIIEMQLRKRPAKRSGWLRLLRDIADYMAATNGDAEVPEES